MRKLIYIDICILIMVVATIIAIAYFLKTDKKITIKTDQEYVTDLRCCTSPLLNACGNNCGPMLPELILSRNNCMIKKGWKIK